MGSVAMIHTTQWEKIWADLKEEAKRIGERVYRAQQSCPKAGLCSVSKEPGESGVEWAGAQLEGDAVRGSRAGSWRAL